MPSNHPAMNDKTSNCFEVKESQQKFFFLGCGASVVAIFLLIFTPRFFSVVTLIGVLLAVVGLIMIYKSFNVKTLMRINSLGIWTSREGTIPWSEIEDYSTDTISKSAIFTLQCRPPRQTVLIDISMSTVRHIKEVTDAITLYSGDLLVKKTLD